MGDGEFGDASLEERLEYPLLEDYALSNMELLDYGWETYKRNVYENFEEIMLSIGLFNAPRIVIENYYFLNVDVQESLLLFLANLTVQAALLPLAIGGAKKPIREGSLQYKNIKLPEKTRHYFRQSMAFLLGAGFKMAVYSLGMDEDLVDATIGSVALGLSTMYLSYQLPRFDENKLRRNVVMASCALTIVGTYVERSVYEKNHTIEIKKQELKQDDGAIPYLEVAV